MLNTLVGDRLLFILVLVAITVRDTFITITLCLCRQESCFTLSLIII